VNGRLAGMCNNEISSHCPLPKEGHIWILHFSVDGDSVALVIHGAKKVIEICLNEDLDLFCGI
jgi:hypothetical protein